MDQHTAGYEIYEANKESAAASRASPKKVRVIVAGDWNKTFQITWSSWRILTTMGSQMKKSVSGI